MGVAHVELVHRDPYECKVKGFRAVSSIERNVSKRRHLQGVREVCGRVHGEMGFQIRQTRPATLQQAMEAAQNYENSAQSLRKSLRGSEKREKSKTRHKDQKSRKRSKHSDSSSTSSSNSLSGVSSITNSSDSDQGISSGKHGSRNRNPKDKKGKELVKVKLEDGDQKAFMKNIADALEAIKVNLADNRKPRRIVPTSRANV